MSSQVLGSAYGGGVAAPSGNLNIEQVGPGIANISFVINANDSIVLNQDNGYRETREFVALLPTKIGCGLTLDSEHIYDRKFKVYGYNVDDDEWQIVHDQDKVDHVPNLIASNNQDGFAMRTDILDDEDVPCLTKLTIGFDLDNSGATLNDNMRAWCDYIICYEAKLRYSVCYNLTGCEKFAVRLANISTPNDTTDDTTVPSTVDVHEASTLPPAP
jgi:hypothetical protein